jgi:hypothetical protein
LENQTYTTPNVFDQLQNQLPIGLNILTVLSFIGNPLKLIFGIIGFFTACKYLESLDKMDELRDTGFGKYIPEIGAKEMRIFELNCQHRVTVLIVTIFSVVLCIVGAILLRQRKQLGLFMFGIGALLYPVVKLTLGIMDTSSIKTIVMSFGFPIIFIILYATQWKYLKK